MGAELRGDLHRYDVAQGAWLDLTYIAAPGPSPRMDMGFASFGNYIYLFGGLNSNGTLLIASHSAARACVCFV